MQRKISAAGSRIAVAVFVVTIFLAHVAASQEKVIYSFSDPSGSVLPVAGVISDAAGNLYGTTFYGGANGAGMVFKLTPTAGGWSQSVLHSFNFDGVDGFFSTGGLVFDAAGNLYGTTQYGGSGNCSNGFGCGTAFMLAPTASGEWTETILHEFQGYDGFQVRAGLTRDAAGNLYGTSASGGSFNQGTVFELSPGQSGHWTGKTLHHFSGGSDGGVPYGSVTLDAAGNVYGTTSAGGGATSDCKYGCGTVFELSPDASGDGHWTGKILHSFSQKSSDGRYPAAGLIFDAAGNLYGTAGAGGNHSNSGIAFELIPTADGHWTEKLLYNFNNQAGIDPSAGLTFDAAGNLYSTTLIGGALGGGTAFKLTPSAKGPWTETTLHNFSSQDGDGANPLSGLIFDVAGNLYGTTGSGGTDNLGTVFEITQ